MTSVDIQVSLAKRYDTLDNAFLTEPENTRLNVRFFMPWYLAQLSETSYVLTVFLADPNGLFASSNLNEYMAKRPDLQDDVRIWESTTRKWFRSMIPNAKLDFRYVSGWETVIGRECKDAVDLDPTNSITPAIHAFYGLFAPYGAVTSVKYRTEAKDLILYIEGPASAEKDFELPNGKFWIWVLDHETQIRESGIARLVISYRPAGTPLLRSTPIIRQFELRGDWLFKTARTELKITVRNQLYNHLLTLIKKGREILTDQKYIVLASLYRAITATPRRIPANWYIDAIKKCRGPRNTIDWDVVVDWVKIEGDKHFSFHPRWGRNFYGPERTQQMKAEAKTVLDAFRERIRDCVVKGDRRRAEDRLRVLNQILDLVYDSESWKAGRHSTYQRIKTLFTPHLESTEWAHVRERLEYIHNTWVKISAN